MITCKEDLVNTYINNDFGELRDLYIKIALENNVKVCGSGGYDYLLSKKSIGVRDWGSGPQLEWGNGGFENAELVTLSDLKPKPTKFVKVEESIFDLKGEFERGELYYMNMGHYNKCETWRELAHFMIEDELYRQVEKEIEERQEFVDRARGMFVEGVYFERALEKMYDAGCRFQD